MSEAELEIFVDRVIHNLLFVDLTNGNISNEVTMRGLRRMVGAFGYGEFGTPREGVLKKLEGAIQVISEN